MITTRESLMVVTGNPWSKRRPKISKGGHRTHQDPADKAAEDETRRQLKEQWGTHRIWTGNIQLYVSMYRFSRQMVDLDNLMKHLQDAGNGLLWVDDSQITGYGRVELFVDRDNPRTEFYIVPHFTNLVRNKAIPGPLLTGGG